MAVFGRVVEFRSSRDPQVVVEALARVVDAPLSCRDVFGTVKDWTLYGRVAGMDLHVESAGTFDGWSARNGMGIWQPILDLRVTPTRNGSLIQGRARFRRSFVALAIVLIGWGATIIAEGAVTIARDVGRGDLTSALPWMLAILALAILPMVATTFVGIKGIKERDALVERFASAVERLNGAGH